jgi:hypothetical protein
MELNTPTLANNPLGKENLSLQIQKAPSMQDWQFFHRQSDSWRQELWLRHQKLGYKLHDWTWEWRLGWIKACTNIDKKWCSELIDSGLKDKAAVVRGQAAQALGRGYRSKEDLNILKTLVNAAKDERNFRNSQPLFVQMQILYAIKLLGGKDALESGEKIAAQHPSTQSYWQKLTKG